MRAVGAVIGGFAAGFAVGVLGVAVHAGPLDLPVVGLLLACIIVGSGSWFLWVSGWSRAWLSAVVGVAAATVWLLMFPPANDSFVSVDQWVSQAWLLLAPLSAIAPAWVRGSRRKNE